MCDFQVSIVFGFNGDVRLGYGLSKFYIFKGKGWTTIVKNEETEN